MSCVLRRLGATFLDRSNVIVTATVGFAVLWTRSSGMAYFAATSVACALTAKVIKKVVRQARPPVEAALRVKKSYGMPSTHSAVVTFQATYSIIACLNLPIHPSVPLHDSQRLLPVALIVPWAIAIMVSRVRLGYHTWQQVLAGFSWGIIFCVVAFRSWTGGLNEYGQELEQFLLPYLWWINKYL